MTDKKGRAATTLRDKGCDMEASNAEPNAGAGRAGGAAWFCITLALIVVVGGALAAGAYLYAEPQLTVPEALAAGFGGLAALIVGLAGAAIGVVLGLVGALLGVAAAGGAVAVTLFIIASPIIAAILFVLLLRRGRSCPDPSAHE